MRIYDEGGQASLFAPDGSAGRMSPACSAAASLKGRTSGSSWNRSPELQAIPYLSLDLTPGAGNLLGNYEWELHSPWRGRSSTLNTGPAPPSGDAGCSLSRILQDNPPRKYYLTRKACLGILRRAAERGKELPKKLKRALEIQAGLVLPDGRPTKLEAYHINQRDEGIDLHGVSGALMATSNMQMQPFVTQPDGKENEGYDGAIQPIAFAANQRDEVRDLHDVAGALGAQPGMKQQTFIAAGFSAGQGSKAGGVGYQEECAPTLKASDSGTNMVPSVLCLNDQGGSVMECSQDVTGTLRAQEHGHQPLVYENHGIDARHTGPHRVAPTMSARYGTGGNNVPLVEQDAPVYCIVGNAIDRQPQNGGNGIGYQEDIAYTLTATDHHAVFSRQRLDVFTENEVVSTESTRQHKDATNLVAQPYQDAVGTLVRSDHKGISNQYVGDDKCIVESHNLIRRLTPLECERLQGFPDGWTNIPGASDSARYKALGNSVAIPCVEYVMRGIAIALQTGRRRRVWLVIVIRQIEIRSTGIGMKPALLFYLISCSMLSKRSSSKNSLREIPSPSQSFCRETTPGF